MVKMMIGIKAVMAKMVVLLIVLKMTGISASFALLTIIVLEIARYLI